jgi:ABC-type nitrate/sulfonate/bicarbonate transport system permease component
VKGRAGLQGIAGILVFLALWQAAVASGLARYEYLPAPSAILAALVALAQSPAAYGEIAHTVAAALIGWAIALAVGLTLGAALGLSPGLRRYSLASVEILRPLPAVALVPVALLLFGFSIETELFVIVIPTVWPILVNTMGGIATVPERLRDVARTFRLSPLAAVAKIFIPAAAPAVLVGCRLSMTIALVLAIVAEMIGNPEGVGYAVVREAQALQPELMFAYVFVTGILGIALNAALVALARLLLPGEFRRPSVAWDRSP